MKQNMAKIMTNMVQWKKADVVTQASLEVKQVADLCDVEMVDVTTVADVVMKSLCITE